MNNYENKGQQSKQQNQQKQSQPKIEAEPKVETAQKSEAAQNEKKRTGNVLPLAQNVAQEKYDTKDILQNIDIATRLMNETFSISKNHVEACVEACGIIAEGVQNIKGSVYEATNASISENVEHLKQFFNCRTAMDLFSLQNRLSQINMKNFLDNQSKIQNMLFDLGTKASEPFSDRISDAGDRISKIIK